MLEIEKLFPETSFFRTLSRGTTTMMRKRRRKRRMEGRKKSERRRLITTKSNERTILEYCKQMQFFFLPQYSKEESVNCLVTFLNCIQSAYVSFSTNSIIISVFEFINFLRKTYSSPLGM